MFHVKHVLAPCASCALSLLLLTMWGCPAGEPEPDEDAGVEEDASGADVGADASDADVGADAHVDASDGDVTEDASDGELPQTCEGACQVQDAMATFGETTEPLEIGFYGLNEPAEDGTRTLYVELHGDASPSCPTQNSPTPGRTLVLSGLPWPLEARAYTLADDGLVGSLLDFENTLIDGVAPARATAVTVTPRAASVCVECVGEAAPSDADGFVALDVSLTFERGTLSGSAYATHCDSYDE